MAVGGPHPQTSIPIAADVLRQFGDVRDAMKAVKAEARESLNEIKKVQRAGGVVSAELTTRFQRADKLKADLEGIAKREREIEQGIKDTRKTGKALTFLLGAQAIRQIAAGGILDPGVMASFAFSVLGPSGVITENASKIFGPGSRITKVLTGASAAVPVVGAMVSQILEAIRTRASDSLAERQVGKLYGEGHISEGEFALFQAQNGKTFNPFARSPMDALKDAQSGFAAFNKLGFDTGTANNAGAELIVKELVREESEVARKSWLPAFSAIKDLQLFGEKAKELPQAIEDKIKSEETRLGRELTQAEREEDAKNLFTLFLADLPDDLREKLAKKLNDAIEKERKKKDRRKTASEIFMEREIDKEADLQFAGNRRRLALTGPIGD